MTSSATVSANPSRVLRNNRGQMLNICMIGHGMMGRWHSKTLASEPHCRCYMLVGRRAEATAAFAVEHGYYRWTIDLEEALADPSIDLFIVASPSEDHAGMATRCLESGRHTLCEIPIGMNLAEARSVVRAAEASDRKLGLVYPMRMMQSMIELRQRIAGGTERLSMIESRFIIQRWENIGATGYRRSWTDNLLWHHLGHLVDFGLWMSDSEPASVSGVMSPLSEKTGTAMNAAILINTGPGLPLTIVGSYAGHESICETMVLTDRETYRIDAMTSRLTIGSHTVQLQNEEADCAAVLRDFLDAVRHDREPRIPGRSSLPMMAVLQQVQDEWDRQYGSLAIPGRGASRK